MLRYYFSETFNIYYMKKIYLFLFTIALSAGSVFSQKTNEIYFSPNAAPTGPVRNIAEWEPTEAVMVAYHKKSDNNGWGISSTVLKDIASVAKLIIVCPSSYQNTVQGNMTSWGISNYSFIITSTTDSWWTRDYTGWFIADGNNTVGIVDFPYNRDRPNDDVVPAKQASLLGISNYYMGLTHTGGNYMCDGYGTGASTTLVQTENSSMTISQIQTLVKNYLGLDDYIMYEDAQGDYIAHIDCWAKFLAPDKILVDSVPSSDPRWSEYESAATYFKNKTCPYGYKYKVTRVLIGGSGSSPVRPYSNSLICNNRVFVPIAGGSNATADTACLRAYRKAMPGYIVKGYTPNASWYNTDALHCRTHEVADRGMVYIQHYPLYGEINSYSGYDVTAKVLSYAKKNIATGYPKVVYKVNSGAWDSIPMTLTSTNNYKATIPVQNNGSMVYYYITATDVDGKRANHPYIGSPDPYPFKAVGTNVNVNELTATPNFTFFAFPNPGTTADLINLSINCEKAESATVKIYSITGSLMHEENLELNAGINLSPINSKEFARGVYYITIQTASSVLTKQLVIQ